MKRKPLGSVFHEFVVDEFKRQGTTRTEFGQNLGIKSTTLHKLLNHSEPGLHSSIMDKVLENTNTTMAELLDKYGEYEI